MNFLRNYVRFKNEEMAVIFEREVRVLTKQSDTMGIEQLLLTLAKQEGHVKGREEGRLEKDILVVRNLLTSTSFTDNDIARLVGVEVAFVAQIRAQLNT
jgi:hypothetical protein